MLLYHVVAGHFDPRRVFYIRSAEALQTQDLFAKRGRKNPTTNRSEIEGGGVPTENGLVWLIDSVLLPQFQQKPECFPYTPAPVIGAGFY